MSRVTVAAYEVVERRAARERKVDVVKDFIVRMVVGCRTRMSKSDGRVCEILSSGKAPIKYSQFRVLLFADV